MYCSRYTRGIRKNSGLAVSFGNQNLDAKNWNGICVRVSNETLVLFVVLISRLGRYNEIVIPGYIMITYIEAC